MVVCLFLNVPVPRHSPAYEEVVTYCLLQTKQGRGLARAASCTMHKGKHTDQHNIYTPKFFAGAIVWCLTVYSYVS